MHSFAIFQPPESIFLYYFEACFICVWCLLTKVCIFCPPPTSSSEEIQLFLYLFMQVMREIYRVLKPGGRFAMYEWITTDKYNPKDPHHVKIKDDILVSCWFGYSTHPFLEHLLIIMQFVCYTAVMPPVTWPC